jgi:hypothetical protein
MVEQISAARRFITNLFTRYGHGNDWQDVKRQYHDHLSKYILPDDQWTAMLSDIVSNEEKIPSLAVIESYLRHKRTEVNNSTCKGWLCFTLWGHRYAVRIEKPDTVWVYARAEARTYNGMAVMQKNPGKVVVIPRGAVDVVQALDNPTDLEPDEIPTKTEIAEIFAANWTGSKENLVKYLKILAGPQPVDGIAGMIGLGKG